MSYTTLALSVVVAIAVQLIFLSIRAMLRNREGTRNILRRSPQCLAVISLLTFGAIVGWQVQRCQECSATYDDCVIAAAESKNLEDSKKYLRQALDYAESMPDGSTSVLYHSPNEDVAEWKENLRTSLQEMESEETFVSTTETPKKKKVWTNINGKWVRFQEDEEVLEPWQRCMLENGVVESTTHGKWEAIHPPGISVYPYNAPTFWTTAASLLCFVLFQVYAICKKRV